MSNLPALPEGVTITSLMRMSATEVLTTYGPEVSALVASLQGSGIVPRDGRSNEDLRLQAEMRLKLSEEGDCEPGDTYRAEALALAEKKLKEEERDA